MAQTFKSMVIGFFIAGLFFLSMLSFAVLFSSENDSNGTILGNPYINSSYHDIQSNLNDAQDTAETQREGFESEVPQFTVGSFLLVSIISVGKVFTSTIVLIFNVLAGVISDTLGIPPVVVGIVSAIFLLTAVLLAWRLYRIGE